MPHEALWQPLLDHRDRTIAQLINDGIITVDETAPFELGAVSTATGAAQAIPDEVHRRDAPPEIARASLIHRLTRTLSHSSDPCGPSNRSPHALAPAEMASRSP